jgi:hypothetical protein
LNTCATGKAEVLSFDTLSSARGSSAADLEHNSLLKIARSFCWRQRQCISGQDF